MKCNLIFYFTLLTILIFNGSVTSEDEVEESTASTSMVTSKESNKNSTDLSNSVTTTKINEETTTEEYDEEEYETPAPKGLVGQLLMDGPDLKMLPKNSSPENVYKYLSEIFNEELKKEFEKYMSEFHEYFFLLQELVSQKCFLSLMRWTSNAQKGQSQALKLLDSSAKFLHNGYFDGTFTDLGNFDQCIRNDNPVKTSEEDIQFNGRYCLVRIRPPMPKARPHLRYSDRILDFRNTSLENASLDHFFANGHSLYSNPFQFGMCFVSECETNDIKSLLNNSLHKFHFDVEVGNDCYTEDVIRFVPSYFFNKLDFASGLSILLIGAMGAIVGLATSFEIVYNFFNGSNIKDSEKPIILCFSCIANIKQLFSLKNDFEDKSDLKSIHGIKDLAIIWIVISNVYLLGYQPQIRALIKNVQSEMNIKGSCLPFQLILNSWNASEIFFFIGGILIAYTLTNHLNRNNGKINLIKYFAKRLLRLLPSILFPLLLVFLLPIYPNGGPIYKSSTGQLRDTCAENWWKSLLFINNWLEPNKTCLPQLWFVSAFLQLNLIAMFVLIISYKKPRLLNCIVLTLGSIGIAIPMYNTYKNKLSAKSPFMDRPLLNEIPNDLKLKHFLTFNHLSVFFIGILIGVKLCSEKSKSTLNLIAWLLLWMVLPLISLISVFITVFWNNPNSDPSLLFSILFNGFNRIFFISGIAWVVNECVNKRAGIIDKVLSNKQFLPLSRLVYQIYLLNLLVIWFYFFTKRDLIIYRHIELFYIGCGVFATTVVISIFGYLVFELPFIRISQRIFTSGKGVTEREIKSQLSQKQYTIQLETIDLNGSKLNDQNINIRL